MKKRLELDYVQNPNCKKGCNKFARLEITENDLCIETNSIVDNLPIRCVGKWSIQKIYHLIQYFGIFANGMKNKWSGKLNYIEVCCGPGRCISREDGLEFDGTALSIIKHNAFQHINKALFFDINEIVIDTLNKRFGKIGVINAKAKFGDYYQPQEICEAIDKEIKPGCLNLVFIDPTDCSVPFALIKMIKETLRKVDFIINLASGTDFNRNIINALLNQEKFSDTINKYSNFINNPSFFDNPDNIKLAKEKNNLDLRNNFRKSYIESLKLIGYQHFDYKNINRFYDILFASSDKMGISFWGKANRIKFDGQRELF